MINSALKKHVDDIPVLPLIFDELCLAIGDERYFFPVGNEPPPTAVDSDERSENPDFFAAATPKDSANFASGVHQRKHSFPWRRS